MQHNPTYDLNIVMHHIPGDQVAGCHPFVIPMCFVAYHLDIFMLGGKLDVEIKSRYLQVFILLEPAGGFAHDGKGSRQDC